MKYLLVVCVVLGLGVAQAPLYLGFGATLANTSPLPSVQVGGPVAQNVELRGTLDSLGIISVFGVDALYKFPVSGASLGGYVGGGPDAVLAFIGGDNFILGLHATVGLEYFTSSLGIYGELQPLIPVSGFNRAPVLGKLRVGVNFYF